MQIHRNIQLSGNSSENQSPTQVIFNRAVLTIGAFDGVHLGHQEILSWVKKVAAENKGESVLLTFHPHPRKVVNHGKAGFKLLTTMEERIQLIASNGIDHLVITPFTEDFAAISAEEYIKKFLVRFFQPHTIIIGYDHRFGQGRRGDYQLLDQLSLPNNYKLMEIPEQLIQSNVISSTRIREALQAGQVIEANRLLGYPYFFSGTVVRGQQLGRTLGFPTANLRIDDPEKLIPTHGVYAVQARIDRSPQLIKGMMNIGLRPTVNGLSEVIEVNLFDFNEDIYNSKVEVQVINFIRKEIKFEGLEALTNQLKQDRITAKDMLH